MSMLPTAYESLAVPLFWGGLGIAAIGGIVLLWSMFGESDEVQIVPGDTYNNSGYNLGHMGPVNIGRQPFEMTESVMKEVLVATNGWDTFGVAPLGFNPKSSTMADALCRYLADHGRDARRTGGVGMMTGAHGPLFVGTGSLTGNLNPYSNDKVIYVNADG
ncbi:hypothetical protein [Mesorhizobium sp. M4B.F.Ca.ET.013.02.1.1]|uniref:hypothetical protein n=1 Tax=Mesorhizobium sp. M4B.F.Ca.ET.013.02.1.1 TaxID=2496755 RepID=UPI000FD32C83|nr:hypothetical protein [Mesorhizobium sp. M4B.F.Ca.ET.013.02.1.1]RUW24661.1 hypothetical protein EOA34_14280 [Mesorhizobium sp. M4B.F.Ca.ET.013.02.1.1]